MLELIRQALRVSTDAYDDEIKMLIQAAEQDLGIAGITVKSDSICINAIATYCKMYFNKDFTLKDAYEQQKAQLQMSTGYGL